MKRAKNCFRFVDFQQVDGKPKGGDTAFLQPTVHQGKELLSVEVDRARYLWRGRFSRNNIVLPRASLEEEPPVLNKGGHARIAQRIGVIGTRIQGSEIEYLLRNIHDVDALEPRLVNESVCRDTAAIADKQHVF